MHHSAQKSFDSNSSKSHSEPNFELFISGALESISIAVIGTEKELFKHTVDFIIFFCILFFSDEVL